MQIDHIAMYVNDLEAAKDFFVSYYQAVPNEGYHNPKPSMEDEEKGINRTGFSHIAIRVGSRDAVDALTLRLKNDGYAVVSGPRTTGDGYYESCIVDLEGNQIEITV